MSTRRTREYRRRRNLCRLHSHLLVASWKFAKEHRVPVLYMIIKFHAVAKTLLSFRSFWRFRNVFWQRPGNKWKRDYCLLYNCLVEHEMWCVYMFRTSLEITLLSRYKFSRQASDYLIAKLCNINLQCVWIQYIWTNVYQYNIFKLIYWNEFIINVMYIVSTLCEMVELYWKYN